MTIPRDPVMLLSYINTQLRDYYSSLTELCDSMQLSEKEIRERLQTISYSYDETQNRFL